MHFNPEITLGTIVETITFVVAIVGASIKFGKLEQKVNIMYHWFEETVISHKGVPTHQDKKFFGVSE